MVVGSHAQVIECRQGFKDLPSFRDLADSEMHDGAGALSGNVIMVKHDLPLPALKDPGNAHEKGRFPGPVCPQHTHDLPFLYFQGDFLEGLDSAIVDTQFFNGEHHHFPRYAVITSGLFRISEGVPSAIRLP